MLLTSKDQNFQETKTKFVSYIGKKIGLKTQFELSRTLSHQELPVFIINEIIIKQNPGIILAIFILNANKISFDGI